MRRWFSVLAIAGLLAGAMPAQERSALESDPKGWTDIFPGARLKGWTRISIPPGQPVKDYAGWKVDAKNKVLLCEGDKLGHEWLRYGREFSDFILHVEWRFHKLEGSPRYNSGIFVRNSADGVIWHQAQTGNAGGGFLFGDTLVNGEKQRVNLSKQIKEQRVKAAGEWNTYEIHAEGRTIRLWVNGAVTSEFTECEVPKGYVGLEAEGFPIEFRNIRIKPLKARR